MNHKKIFLAALLSLGTASAIHAQSRCMASPYPVTVKQPDGTSLTVIGYGNIDVNYSETVDGYTVVRNNAGIYEYAAQSAGGDLQATGIKANDPAARSVFEEGYLKNQTQHLRYSPEKADQLFGKSMAGPIELKPGEDGHSDEILGAAVSGSFPQQGKRKILLILIQYPDLKAKYTSSDFNNLMNQDNYKGIGSFSDFYYKNSFGKLDLDIDVMGWYTADSGYKYYANSEGKERTRKVVANAIDSAEAMGVDFSKYDNDKDGDLDGLMVIHSGPGAEEGGQNDYIWSHRWTLSTGDGTARTLDGVKIRNYAINPESRNGQSRLVGIGVLCHEFGHLLGLPDLYDVTNQSSGLGNWSLMAGGCWLDNENTPANDDAWSKIALGWIQPKVIDLAGYYTLKPASNDTLVYKISTPVSHEYFLLENRQLTGFDKKLPWKGMAIWHVNDSVLNKTLGNNTVNANKELKGIDMEEADGNNGLDNVNNRGDAGDLFPGMKSNTLFDDDASPSARTYNGKASGIRVFAITVLPDSSVKFGFGALPQAIFTPSFTSICQGKSIQFENKSKFATGYSWDFGDGSTADTTYSPGHTFAQPGVYYVKLTAFDNGNTTMDSVKITVNAAGEADFDWTVDRKVLSITNKSKNAKSYFWYWGDGKVGYNSTETFTRTYADTGVYNVKLVVVAAGGCNDTIIKQVHVTDISGIAENGKEIGLRAYPNPADDIVHLEFSSPNPTLGYVSIVNSLGQDVMAAQQVAVASGANRIPLVISTLKPGFYFMKLLLDGKAYYIPVARN